VAGEEARQGCVNTIRSGMEIKAWFPLATEITARFYNSQAFLQDYNTKVVVICWLPEFDKCCEVKSLNPIITSIIPFPFIQLHTLNAPWYGIPLRVNSNENGFTVTFSESILHE